MAAPAVVAGHAPAAAPVGYPPGPSSSAFSQGLRYLVRPQPWLRELHARHGPRVTIRFIDIGTLVLLADPDDCKRVFTAPDDVLLGGRSNALLEPFVGARSILLLDGAEHLRARRLLLPPFHGKRMAAYEGIVEEVTRARIASWRPGDRLPLQREMQAITLEVIARAIFGVDRGARAQELKALIGRTFEMIQGTLRAFLSGYTGRAPLKRVSRFGRALARMDELVYAEIAERREDPGLDERDDVLSLMLQARDEEGRPMSDVELRDELVTMLGAGHETTATSLAWAFERILRHRDVHARLREEVAAGERAYLDATVNETLRVRPVLPLTSRMAAVPFELDGLTVPAGTILAPNIHVVNRRADLYPQPDRFLPERFLDGKPPTYGWLPFGGGGRRCLGAAFAQMEMRVVMATILGSVTLRAPDPRAEAVTRRGVVLAPAKGGLVEVVPH
jgi:cytochrome P450